MPEVSALAKNLDIINADKVCQRAHGSNAKVCDRTIFVPLNPYKNVCHELLCSPDPDDCVTDSIAYNMNCPISSTQTGVSMRYSAT